MLETTGVAGVPVEWRVRGDRPELGKSSVQGKEDNRQLRWWEAQFRSPALLDSNFIQPPVSRQVA